MSRKDITVDEFIILLQALSDDGKGNYHMLSEYGCDAPCIEDPCGEDDYGTVAV